MSRYLWFSIVLTVVVAGFTLFLYGFGHDYMPERVPVHWNIEGKADDYVRAKPWSTLAIVALAAMTIGFLTARR